MSNSKKALFNSTIRQGLSQANKGNPFWNKSAAMQSLALMHNLNRGTK